MTCLLKSVVRRENGKGIEVQQNFAAYRSSHGHYLFSPESPVAVEFKDNISCRVVTVSPLPALVLDIDDASEQLLLWGFLSHKVKLLCVCECISVKDLGAYCGRFPA